MKHLLLLRHAKSSWNNPGLKDFDRPLNKRGLIAAVIMADFLSEYEVQPDYVLCSSAQRTRETITPLIEISSQSMEVHFTRNIYEASYLSILEEVQKVPDAVETLLVIGHNPGMEDLAAVLCDEGSPEAVDLMAEKFPTAALAHITLTEKSWSSVGRDKGFLKKFVRPKDLS